MKYKPELHKLSNGTAVIFDPMDLETASVRVVFFTGSRDEKPSEYGITHFCEHMFFNASKRFCSSKARREYLEDNGCSLNGFTSDARLQFVGDCVARNLNILIDCMGEQLQNPLFDKTQIEHERGIILDELRRAQDKDKNSDNEFIYNNLFNCDYDHTLGTEENIKSFTRKQMLFFIRRRMSSSNCVIIVSGKIKNKEKTLAQLEKSFGFLKPFDVPENKKMKYLPKCVHKSRSKNSEVIIRILVPTLWPNDKEYEFQRICVNKFKSILGTKIFNKLRSESGLVYGTSLTNCGNETVSLTGIRTATAPEHVAECVAQMARVCADVYYNNAFTQQDVDRLDARASLGDAKNFDSLSFRASNLEREYRAYQELYDMPGIIKVAIAITREQIIKNTRGFFDGKMSIVTSGPKFDGDLMKIWRDNFKPNDNPPVLDIVKQNKKTR